MTTPDQTPQPRRDREAEVHALLNQGARYLRAGKADEAIRVLQQAQQLTPESAPVLLNLGAAYIMSGRQAEAVPVLERARTLEPDNAMIWTNLGAALLGNPVLATEEQQGQAIEAFRKALALDPRAPHVHYNLGLILKDRGDRYQAAMAFRRALHVNPSDRDARYWLSQLHLPDKEGDSGDS